MKTSFRPMIMLAVLSPLTAEFLLGDQYLSGMAPAGQQIGMLISFIALYGMGAVLIRELARRLRLGWAGLLLLALGYGIFEEGLITQTLFNPHYLGLNLLAPGHIGLLGIGAPWTVFVISLHVIWSICTPIAIVEAWHGSDGTADTRPWLGRAATVVCLIIFAIGAAAILTVSTVFASPPFLAHPAQLIIVAVLVLLVVLAAVRLRGRGSDVTASLPATPARIGWSALLGFLATTAFQLINGLPDRLAWLSFAGMLAVWAVALLIMVSRRPDPFGLAVGAVLTYAWVGMRSALGEAGLPGLVEQSLLILLFLAGLAWSYRRLLNRAGQPARPERSTVRS
ncbi:hypothetical protein FOE78_10225 [Microlunatus elymi]|uniref:DUF998 domain-containing protein n=1 Tax=Microlunatus elymi TaxID=2596828 RepID=A0A516PYI2_9ACTN|nr:hypothetical protein [Microlunatus elymi]QDP96228.1 hypothetical protein FOE78_10225 [Microlunatus elymi]